MVFYVALIQKKVWKTQPNYLQATLNCRINCKVVGLQCFDYYKSQGKDSVLCLFA